METAVIENRQTVDAKAWRISFRDGVPAGEAPLLVLREPNPLVVVSEPIDATALVHDTDSRDALSLRVLWIPPGATVSAGLEAAWVEEPSARQRVVRAGLRAIRVVWSDQRAIIYSAAEQLHDALDAVIRFTVAEREAAGLERQMAEIWPAMDRHAPLTYAPRRRDFRGRRTELTAMTHKVTLMTGALLRLETALEQLDPTLASTSKRLYAELVLQAGIYERLEMLEDPVDFAMEHYELANTRMIDAKTASNELWLEGGILLALVVEVGVVALDFFK